MLKPRCATIQRMSEYSFQLFFAKNCVFIGKMKDFGVSRLKLRVQMFNIWMQMFNLRVQRLNLRMPILKL